MCGSLSPAGPVRSTFDRTRPPQWKVVNCLQHGAIMIRECTVTKKNCLYFGFFFTLSNQKRVCVCFYFHFINDIVLYTVGMCRFRLCIEYPYKTNRHSTTKCYVFKCLLMVCSRCIAPIVCREFYKYFYQINNIVNFVNLFLSLRWLVCAVHSSHNNLYTQHASCLICV